MYEIKSSNRSRKTDVWQRQSPDRLKLIGYKTWDEKSRKVKIDWMLNNGKSEWVKVDRN